MDHSVNLLDPLGSSVKSSYYSRKRYSGSWDEILEGIDDSSECISF